MELSHAEIVVSCNDVASQKEAITPNATSRSILEWECQMAKFSVMYLVIIPVSTILRTTG